jgi:hypothetical protein
VKGIFSFSSYSPLFGVITSLNPPHKEKKNKVRVSFFGLFSNWEQPRWETGKSAHNKKKKGIKP